MDHEHYSIGKVVFCKRKFNVTELVYLDSNPERDQGDILKCQQCGMRVVMKGEEIIPHSYKPDSSG
jgi:DNA-directed RNA polymerase subunit RPC12/RpoP